MVNHLFFNKKRIQKNLVVLICFLLYVGTIRSQEKYKVIYDYNTENIVYYRLDKNNQPIDTLSKPRIKRNSLVEILVKNVNPFAVNLITDVREEAIHESGQGFNFSSLLGGINSFADDDLQLNVKNLPENKLFTDKTRSRGGNVSQKFSDLNNIATNVVALKSTLISNLLNPNLNKDSILANLNEVANVQKDIRISDPSKNFYLYLSNLEKIIESDKQDIVTDVNEMLNEIEDTAQNEGQVSRGDLIARNTAFKDLQNLINSLDASSAQTKGNLNKIKELYTLLEGASFEQTFDYLIEADKVNVELKFVQSDFSEKSDTDNTKATIKIRNIKLFSKGGFKINTSVALTLNNFESNSSDYYISESGIIGADPNDFFIPNLSTMINFYPVIGENFNVGGSFGLSIPISSDIGGMSFLLGPSIFLGNKSRLSLSGGVAYGPVTRLTNGLQVGDSTDLRDLTNFTQTVYDFGYYFGISFSLFDIN